MDGARKRDMSKKYGMGACKYNLIRRPRALVVPISFSLLGQPLFTRGLPLRSPLLRYSRLSYEPCFLLAIEKMIR